ncbi:MAG: PKD domain-containing protein [Methanophagales archaeon]|nr:PKD domain-containing protein [Methanophagales archaeon]
MNSIKIARRGTAIVLVVMMLMSFVGVASAWISLCENTVRSTANTGDSYVEPTDPFVNKGTGTAEYSKADRKARCTSNAQIPPASIGSWAYVGITEHALPCDISSGRPADVIVSGHVKGTATDSGVGNSRAQARIKVLKDGSVISTSCIFDISGTPGTITVDKDFSKTLSINLEPGHNLVTHYYDVRLYVESAAASGGPVGSASATAEATYSTITIDVKDTTPPTTTDDYDGEWHTSDFTITLTATDDYECNCVKENYYKINSGLTKKVSVDGQPVITTESETNTLEYWSDDKKGNEETHNTLNNIKLDKTPPIAAFTHSVSELTVNFDASGSTDATSGIDRYEWDFGDGKTGSGVSPSHTYPDAGTYTVTLKVWDKAGNDGTGTAQVAHPVSPVPELSTVILFSLGLLTLVGYVALRKKNK